MMKSLKDIYSKFVIDETDLAGHIAYSFYIRNRIDFGQNETLPELLRQYDESNTTPEKVAELKIKSQDILREVIEKALIRLESNKE